MPGEYCLDTNIAVAALNGRPAVARRLKVCRRIVLPFPVVGELLYGAKKSGRPEANLKSYRRFIEACEVHQSDSSTVELYADLKLQLKLQGTPIPENDIWAAACALELALPLVTHDSHFQHIPQLSTEDWLSDEDEEDSDPITGE